MKPISLTMQAFGPYLDAATVDFSRLGEHPIFLITGSTGGGENYNFGCHVLRSLLPGDRWEAKLGKYAEHVGTG